MNHDYPKNLSIQTTSLCNGRCIFCPYEELKGIFPAKIMEKELFNGIIDECARHRTLERIILYLNNEPLTDPYLVERINYAKERVPWASVHLLTNASLLTEEMADKLIGSKLDWIGFSLHGIRKETIERAMGLDYDLTLKRATAFIEKAKTRRDINDFIMVTFLRHKYLTYQEKEEAVRFWRGKGIERISYFDGPISRAGNVKDLPRIMHKKLKGCASIWANEMIHIVENGDVILCCMDWKREVVLGNAGRNSIHEIWNSKAYSRIRDMRDGRTDSDSDFICKRCEAAMPEAEEPDLLLVTLPPWGVENPPIGLGYLDSYIKSKGLKTKVLDLNINFHNTVDDSYKMLWHVENKNYWSNEATFPLIKELFKEQIDHATEKILSTRPKLTGFSVVDPKERLTIEIIRRIKEAAPERRIILGGPACSTEEQRDFFTHNIPGHIDYFVVGEGEETLYEALKGEIKGSVNHGLAGVAVKENGKWRYTPREPIEPIDAVAFPTYEGFNLGEYCGGRSLLVEWSRGCIGRCSFCKNYRLTSAYRAKSPELILQELQFLKGRYGIEEFTVCDNTMNGSIAQLHGVCDKIGKRGLRIRWSGQIIPRKEMGPDLFSKMLRAGCRRMQIGVESGSDAVLKNMGKIYTSQIAQDNIRAAKMSGMNTEIFIMIGHPGEGDKEFLKTVEFIKRNAGYIDVIKSINTLHLIAGTGIYENREKYNIKPLPRKDWHYLWETSDGNNYDVRRKRAQALLDLARGLGVKVMETNIGEGKEQSAHDLPPESGEAGLRELKAQINRLQPLPKGGAKMPRKSHSPIKFILLTFLLLYTLLYISYFWLFRKLRGKALLGG